MVLVDTPVWIDHFRTPNPLLTQLLVDAEVLMHPFIIAELALGNLSARTATLADMEGMESVSVARHEEIMRLIRDHRLHGSGVGYVDVHLLASARLTLNTQLWTRDRRLHAAAERLGVGRQPLH